MIVTPPMQGKKQNLRCKHLPHMENYYILHSLSWDTKAHDKRRPGTATVNTCEAAG